MGLGGRLIVYLGLLTIGACLGILSVVTHISLSGWLTRAGLIANPCGAGCPEGWPVSLAGAFLITAVTGVGLLADIRLRYWLWAGIGLVTYAAALRWSSYGFQYGALAAVFGLLAFAAGRGAAALTGRPRTARP